MKPLKLNYWTHQKKEGQRIQNNFIRSHPDLCYCSSSCRQAGMRNKKGDLGLQSPPPLHTPWWLCSHACWTGNSQYEDRIGLMSKRERKHLTVGKRLFKERHPRLHESLSGKWANLRWTLQPLRFPLASTRRSRKAVSPFCACVWRLRLPARTKCSGRTSSADVFVRAALLLQNLILFVCCFVFSLLSFHALSLLSLIYPSRCVGVRLYEICFFTPWLEFCIVLASRKEKVFGKIFGALVWKRKVPRKADSAGGEWIAERRSECLESFVIGVTQSSLPTITACES